MESTPIIAMRRAFTLIELIIVVVIIGILAAILFPVFNRPIHDERGMRCQSNLKQIGLGFLQYMQDYNEKLPPARVGATKGWVDLLKPYVKSTQPYQCPSGPRHNVKTSTDYFYNRRAARMDSAKLVEPRVVILGGDGADDAPYWNSITELPADWASAYPAPSVRHRRGTIANYLFVDGHVKGIEPANIKTTPPADGGNATFAIR